MQHLYGDQARWDQQTHLIADLIDLTNKLLWINVIHLHTTPGFSKNKNILDNPPALLPRPGDEVQKTKVRFAKATDAEAAIRGIMNSAIGG